MSRFVNVMCISIATVCTTGGCKKADLAQWESDHLRYVGSMLEDYHEHHGVYPRRLEDAKKYAPGMSLEDSWGNGLEYTTTGPVYRIRSAGPDGTYGTADDLVRTEKDPLRSRSQE